MNIPKLLFRLLLGRRLPITTGTLEVSGIENTVLIRRDSYGIPYIDAEGDDDAWYGLGFCHGQDRAFQIEGIVRVVRGTLAELVGPAAVPLDRLSRRIGFHHASEEQLKVLDDDIRQMFEIYARGVTDGARVGCRRKAHEFTLLRAQPTSYGASDVLGVLKLMSFTLATNWDCELARLKVFTEDGPEALAALDPAYAQWHPVTSPPTVSAGNAIDRLADDLAIFISATGQGGGSNNWAIAPFRTATGSPILANDWHLPLALPTSCYLAQIRTPDWAVSGASFVGGPVFPAGHNGTVAWGMTAGMVDNTDLFIEEIDPDGQNVRDGNQFVPCKSRLETITVKGGDSVQEKVLITPRGPIVGPALDGDVGAISLFATWLAPRPTRGLFQLHRVRNFEEFRSAFEQWPFLSFNMVYADTAGTVGWQLVGEAPRRRKGWGTIPLSGSDPQVGWNKESIPFEEMPRLVNPKEGFIATANNKPTPDGEGPFLGVDWLEGYRVARIMEVLEARQDWDVAGVQALQMDQHSIPWRELRDVVLAVPADVDEVRQALAMLETWDGIVAADSPAAAVFEFFLAEMERRVVVAKAPVAAEWALGKGFTALSPYGAFSIRRVGHLVDLLRRQPAGWFTQSWNKELANALTTAIETLREQYGPDRNSWKWGVIRPVTLRHPVGERAPLNRIFNVGPFPWGGDADTVGQAAAPPAKPTANPVYAASLRAVFDVGNWDNNRFALPGGQSGNPVSPHYHDLLDFWKRGDGVPIAWSPDKVDKTCRTTLRLVPEG